MMDANLRKIRTKDLHSLEPLHDAIYDNDGRVVGIHGSIAEEELDPLIGNFNLNFVGRSLLDGGHHRQQGTVKYSKRLPRLVRYVGKSVKGIRISCCPSSMRLRIFIMFLLTHSCAAYTMLQSI